MKTPVNSQGHLQHLYSHAMWKGVGMCEGASEDTSCVCVYLSKKICTTLKLLSVDLYMFRYMSVYISFLLFTTVQKRNLKLVLFKRDTASKQPSFCRYVLYIVNREHQSINIRHISTY